MIDWVTLVSAIIVALITSFTSYLLAYKNNKKEIEKIKKQLDANINELKQGELYIIKKQAIFNSLDLIDTYISWLTLNNGENNVVPERIDITPLELTQMGRKCYNELCLTCDNSKLLELFLEIVFNSESNIFVNYAEYRNLAREELGLNKIEFYKDRVFISRISTINIENKINLKK